jgi:hypothetical protein
MTPVTKLAKQQRKTATAKAGAKGVEVPRESMRLRAIFLTPVSIMDRLG